MPSDLDISSLTIWLHSHNPTAPLASLQASLESDKHLSLALHQLKTAIGTRENEQDRDNDAQQARQKIQTLRQSLSRLSAHSNTLSDRLIQAEASLAAQKQQNALQLQSRMEERDGMKALCSVWEARWREERTLREEAEAALRNLRKIDGKVANDSNERSGDRLIVLKGCRKSRKAPAPADEAPANNSILDDAISRETILADLTNELECMRAEMREMTSSKVAELGRVTMELQLRRSEMSQLYASLDQILVLSPSRLAPAYDRRQTVSADRDDSQRHRTRSSSPLVDLSNVGTAKLQFRSQAREPAAVSGIKAEEFAETVKLEEEIRDMERKIRQLSGAPESEGSSIDPEDGSATKAGVVDDSSSPEDLLQLVSVLQNELDSIKHELAIAVHERTLLRERCEEMQQTTAGHTERAELEATAQAYIERLEADRSRLSQLLTSSEAESHALSDQLATTHAQVDELSRRVRLKLEEQKGKLERAYDEIERLEGEIEYFKRRREFREVEGDETF